MISVLFFPIPNSHKYKNRSILGRDSYDWGTKTPLCNSKFAQACNREILGIRYEFRSVKMVRIKPGIWPVRGNCPGNSGFFRRQSFEGGGLGSRWKSVALLQPSARWQRDRLDPQAVPRRNQVLGSRKPRARICPFLSSNSIKI